MKKYKLREHFSIEQKGEVLVGPREVELSDEEFKLEKHKLEDSEVKKEKKEK